MCKMDKKKEKKRMGAWGSMKNDENNNNNKEDMHCAWSVSVVDDIYIYYIGSCVSVVMVVVFRKKIHIYENDRIN